MKSIALLALLFAVLACIVPFASATSYSVYPTQSNAEIQAIVSALVAGDELLVHAGVYVNLALELINIRGTADAWITIKGVPCGTEKPLLSLDTNVVLGLPSILIGSGCEFIKIEGLKLTHSGNGLVAGIFIDVNVHDIILDGLVLDTINGIGIDILGRNNIANIVIQSCILVNIGRIGVSANLGVGIAVGGLNAAVTGVANIQLLNNVIHDVFGWEGSAIKVLLGVSGLKVLDNVIWNCPRGVGPSTLEKAAVHIATGITVNVDALAVVARNLITDTLGASASLTVALRIGAGTQCVNNVILNAKVGIDIVLGGAISLQNTLVAHNTVHRVATKALRCKNIGQDSVFYIVNNVFSVGGGLLGSVLDVVSSLLSSTRVVLINNICVGPLGLGNLLGSLLGGNIKGFISIALDLDALFVSAKTTILADINLLPLGPLVVDVNAQISDLLKAKIELALGGLDFDGNVRVGSYHCGAYQANAGTHWQLAKFFKGLDINAQVEIPCVASATVNTSVNRRVTIRSS